MGHSAILSVRITGNANDAVKAFEKVSRRAAAFGSFVGNVAAKGIEKLWDKLSSFTGDVIDMSDSVDKFKNTLKFAGLDTTAVDKAAASARQYADQTVYDLSDIQNTMAQLAANGIGNYTELAQAAGNLNAVAGGNAQTFGSVAMMLTQTAGAGKLTTENWNQLADAIPGASGKLQEAMRKNGAFVGNFRDAMAKGEITADEFNQALLDLGMTDVAREAATSTATIEGALGNLEAAITGGLADAFNLVKPAVTGAMGAMAETIETTTKAATGWMGDFIDSLAAFDAFAPISAAAARLGSGLRTLMGAIGDLIGALNPFPGSFDTAASAAATTGDILDGLSHVIELAGQKFNALGTWVRQAAAALRQTGAAQALADTLTALWDTAKRVAAAIGAVVSAFNPFKASADSAADAGRTLGNAFKAAADMVRPVLDALGRLADWATSHGTLVRNAIIAIGAAFAGVTGYRALTSGLSSLSTAMGSVAKTANGLTNGLNLMMDMGGPTAMIGQLGGKMNLVKNAQAAWSATTKTATAVQGAFNMVLNANPIGVVVTAIGAVVAALAAFFTQTNTGRKAWSAFMGWLKDTWSRVTGWLQPVIDTVSRLWSNLVDTVKGAWDGFSAWAVGMWESIQAPLGPVIDAIGSLWQSAATLVQALWERASAIIGAIWTQLTTILTPVIDAIKILWEGAGYAVQTIWQLVSDFLGALWGQIVTVMTPVVDAIKAAWATAGDLVTGAWQTVCDFFTMICQVIGGVFDAVTALVRGDWSAAGAAVKNIWNAIGSFFSNLVNRIGGFFSNLGSRIGAVFQSAGNAVKAAWNNVVSWIGGIPGRIMGIFSNAGSWLWNAGSRIISGLWDGLKSAWGNVQNWVGGLGNWIKEHKGPPAYDSILLKDNGRRIMTGFAAGLKSGWASQVVPTVNGFNTALSGMDFTTLLNGATAIIYQDNHKETIQVTFSGVVGDPEAVARQINKLQDDYAAKRR